jgi:serine/threonine protein kinase
MSWNTCGLPDNGLFPEAYTVREVLRDSNVSTILLGFDAVAETDVVIKCFKPEAKGAYLREIGTSFDIHHPNLVTCLNTFYRTDGLACIVYEYLSGGSLLDLLEKQGIADYPTIIACLRAMLTVLGHLHRHERIHCDLKPENIMLRVKDYGQTEFVLIDMGAACPFREAQESQHVLGTPAYIAPERIKNHFFFNSDLYSLGVVAFEMATGKRPFTGTVEELTHANLSDIPPLSGISPFFLRDFIDHLLVKNPQQRIRSADVALHLLDTANAQTYQHKITAFVPAQYRPMQWVLPISEPPTALHCFHVDDYVLMGLVYAHYVRIIDPLYPDVPYKILLSSSPLQVLSANQLVYATPSRIQLLNLRDGKELLIKECLNDLKTWSVQYGRLVWSNAYYTFYEDFVAKPTVKSSAISYLFQSEPILLADGSFATSEGMANNKIVLRDECSDTLTEWDLADPVIAISHSDVMVMAVTLSLSPHISYTIWCLVYGCPPRKLDLPADARQITTMDGYAFWLRGDTELHSCGVNLQPQALTTYDFRVTDFAVSYDRRFICIAYKDEAQQLFLTILKLRAAS